MSDTVTKCNLVPVYKEQVFPFSKPTTINVLYKGDAINVIPNVKDITFSVGRTSLENKTICQMFRLNMPAPQQTMSMGMPPEIAYIIHNIATESVLYPVSSGMILNIDGEIVGEKVDEKDIIYIKPQKKIVPYEHSFKNPKVVSVCFEGKPVLYLQGLISNVSIVKESIDDKSDYIISCQGIENSAMLPKEMGIKIDYSVRIPNKGPDYIKEVYIRETEDESAYIQFVRLQGEKNK